MRYKDRGMRRKNGGFGHRSAKYSKHPAIKHNLDLVARRDSRKAAPIENPVSSVREAIEKFSTTRR